MICRVHIFVFLFCSQMLAFSASAEEVRIAVATNFLATLKEIARNFSRDTRHTVVISPGSSGKLYAQIKHGAPFDVFFSADVKRPHLLEKEGLATQGTRFVYAVGRLTLWSPDADMINGNGKEVLSNSGFRRLAIANPKTAPYGAAAQSALQALGLWNQMKGRLVQGENVGQTLQFVFSRNAQFGFVSLSQVLDSKINGSGSRWDVPEDLHDPLHQEAVLLAKGQGNEAALGFLEYVKSQRAREIIERFGYRLE